MPVFGFESDGGCASFECVVASSEEDLEGGFGDVDALEFGEFGGDGFEVSDGVSGGGEACGVVWEEVGWCDSRGLAGEFGELHGVDLEALERLECVVECLVDACGVCSSVEFLDGVNGSSEFVDDGVSSVFVGESDGDAFEGGHEFTVSVGCFAGACGDGDVDVESLSRADLRSSRGGDVERERSFVGRAEELVSVSSVVDAGEVEDGSFEAGDGDGVDGECLLEDGHGAL